MVVHGPRVGSSPSQATHRALRIPLTRCGESSIGCGLAACAERIRMLEAENSRLRVEEQNRNAYERMRKMEKDNDQMKSLASAQLRNVR